MQTHDRIDFNAPDLSAFAHNLLVDLAVGGDVDHQIALNRAGTAQSTIGLHSAFASIAFLHRIHGGDIFRLTFYLKLGKVPDRGGDLAAPTDTTATADRIQIDAQMSRGLKDGGANRKITAAARRGENHMGSFPFGGSRLCISLGRVGVSHKVLFFVYDSGTNGWRQAERRRRVLRPPRAPCASPSGAASRKRLIQAAQSLS